MKPQVLVDSLTYEILHANSNTEFQSSMHSLNLLFTFTWITDINDEVLEIPSIHNLNVGDGDAHHVTDHASVGFGPPST